MTEWSPPIDGGLSGGAYLSEQLEAFVDDLADAHEPAVYAIKLSQPNEFDALRERWRDAYAGATDEFRAQHSAEEMPAWVREAFEAPGVLYVGAAGDAHARLTNHVEGHQTASICKLFPVHSVWGMWFFETAEEAFDREAGKALNLRNRWPLYVWQN